MLDGQNGEPAKLDRSHSSGEDRAGASGPRGTGNGGRCPPVTVGLDPEQRSRPWWFDNEERMNASSKSPRSPAIPLTHLQRLEGEAIHIMREVVAEAERPVMLYSVGKDSAVMLHLARK